MVLIIIYLFIGSIYEDELENFAFKKGQKTKE